MLVILSSFLKPFLCQNQWSCQLELIDSIFSLCIWNVIYTCKFRLIYFAASIFVLHNTCSNFKIDSWLNRLNFILEIMVHFPWNIWWDFCIHIPCAYSKWLLFRGKSPSDKKFLWTFKKRELGGFKRLL